jgi:DNA repair protein RecN (Recombination protein N)
VLTHLTVHNFAIVEALDFELGPGMTVMTGETGAGKSILVDALTLAVGERASAGVVRPGRERAEIGAIFDLTQLSPVAQWLRDQALDAEEQECVLRRSIASDGRSRAFVNGRAVSVQTLRALGNLLVDIHGQHGHQSLLHRTFQRQLLDNFAGHGETLAALSDLYERLNAIEREINDLSDDDAAHEARLTFLKFQVDELDKLDLKPGELEAIEEEHQRLSHTNELITTCQAMLDTLEGDSERTATNQVSSALRALEGILSYDARLETIRELLNNAAIHLQEATSELSRYASTLESDPERLHWLETRLATLHDLSRKHRLPVAELPQLLQTLVAEITAVEEAEHRIRMLRDEHKERTTEYRSLAATLHHSRARAAKQLSDDITEQMQGLGMPGGRFTIEVRHEPNAPPTAHGLDHIEFLVNTNPGQPTQPLTRIASGGELSRIGLAIQVVAVQNTIIPTLVFDEVDTGIGGRVAEIVGRALRTLGERRQVLCVTHLPQVASKAHHHLQVHKNTQKQATYAHLEMLSGEPRVREIARMLGGLRITDQTLAHAREMLELTEEPI